MKKSISVLKIHLIIILFLWSVSGFYGVVTSIELTDWLLYSLIVIWAALSAIFIYKNYTPFNKSILLYKNHFEVNGKLISEDQILFTCEITPFEKILFALKNPEYDYSASFSSSGLIIKTLYEYFLIDSTQIEFANSKKLRELRKSGKKYFPFFIAYLFPIAAPVLSYSLKTDSLIYVFIMVIIIFFISARMLPAFYLGSKINPGNLPLSSRELNEFDGITIIQGFTMSDKLSFLPFVKPSYLEGLAVDTIIKKYIVLNPRLFALGSPDYLRFVLFHELSHIKHHDGLWSIAVPAIVIVFDVVFSLLPDYVHQAIPYLDYILLGIIAIFWGITVLKRKRFEKRADMDSVAHIGSNGVENIKNTLGYDIEK